MDWLSATSSKMLTESSEQYRNTITAKSNIDAAVHNHNDPRSPLQVWLLFTPSLWEQLRELSLCTNYRLSHYHCKASNGWSGRKPSLQHFNWTASSVRLLTDAVKKKMLEIFHCSVVSKLFITPSQRCMDLDLRMKECKPVSFANR